MGFRFQRRVSLFPGVRLNFSSHGISTTIGPRGASINIGGRGTYLNAGIPGSGISYRTRLSKTEPRRSAPPSSTPSFAIPSPETEIASAAVGSLTTPGLDSLKALIVEAIDRRKVLSLALKHAQRHENFSLFKQRVASFFVLRLATQRFVPSLAKAAFEARQHRQDIEEQLASCLVNIDFGLSAASLHQFDTLTKSFDELSQCGCIWDVTASSAVDRFHERSWASIAVRRKVVRFGVTELDVIRSEKMALCLKNTTGLDLLVYPAFVMARKSRDEFALIDIRDVVVRFTATRFSEEEHPASDAQIIGHTWKKANKDGSRDRRFNSNYEIPIVLYGELALSSGTGLNEAYLVSSYAKTSGFDAAWKQYITALQGSSLGASPQDPAEDGTEPHGQEQTKREEHQFTPPAAPKTFLYDWLALPLVVAGVAFLSWTTVHEAPNAFHYLATIDFHFAEQSKTKPVVALPPSRAGAVGSHDEIAIVLSRRANIRAFPSSSSPVSSHANRGEKFKVFARTKRWTEVGTEQPLGWIKANLIKIKRE